MVRGYWRRYEKMNWRDIEGCEGKIWVVDHPTCTG